MLFNVCEFWALISQVPYLKGTFVTCYRNCSLCLNIYLSLLFIIESRNRMAFSGCLAPWCVQGPMLCPGESERRWYGQFLEPALTERFNWPPSYILLPNARPATNAITINSLLQLTFNEHLLNVATALRPNCWHDGNRWLPGQGIRLLFLSALCMLSSGTMSLHKHMLAIMLRVWGLLLHGCLFSWEAQNILGPAFNITEFLFPSCEKLAEA